MSRPERILTLNAGSATLKFAIFHALGGELVPTPCWRGKVEHIGEKQATLEARSDKGQLRSSSLGARQDAGEAIGDVIEFLREVEPTLRPDVIAHRIVHGGTEFDRPVRIDAQVLEKLAALTPLAPLHQPHNLAGVGAAMAAFVGVDQIACFDTAFHRSQNEVNDMFALPHSFYDEGVRRYGFHGLSYEYIASRLKQISPRLAAGRTIVAHLGSGASMCAMRASVSVSSTMGFSALDGLPMGTRCGQIDPGVLLWLMQSRKLSVDLLSELLYKQSGLLGMSGLSADMRTLQQSALPAAASAIAYFVARIQRELGALSAALGGIDGLVFTGGIGEHAGPIREQVLRGLDWLGFVPDLQANARAAESMPPGEPVLLTAASSRCEAWMIPTDEEQMLARHGHDALGRRAGSGRS